MKYLVTGSSGFIGQNLVDYLLKENHQVIGYDITPAPKRFQRNKNFISILDDINNINAYLTPELKSVDAVFHLCASADVRLGYEDTQTDMYNNILGTYQLLEFMRINKLKKLIFSSSSTVYGNANTVPTPETEHSMKPLSLYASSKASNEAYIHGYSHLFGIEAHIFRFANVVGRYQTRGVIYDFIQKIKKNPKKLHILGNGEQKKSFFHVDDCVKALTTIPFKTEPDIYNLGNTDRISIRKLGDIVCEELNAKPTITTDSKPEGWPGDTKYCFLNIGKALETGWKPTLGCEEAIRKTVKELR